MPPSSTRNLSVSAKEIPVPSVVVPSIRIAAPDTLSAVVMVASLESAIAAEALISAFRITPLAIAVTPALVIDISPETAV